MKVSSEKENCLRPRFTKYIYIYTYYSKLENNTTMQIYGYLLLLSHLSFPTYISTPCVHCQ